MSFLTDTDYDVQARAEILRVLEVSSLSRGKAENMAQEEMTGYLRPRGYNVPAIFAAVADARNPLIIMYLVDMSLYHLHSNISGRAMPEQRVKRYEAAIDWLEKVNANKLDPSLPYLAQDPDAPLTTPTIKLGGGDKYASRW